jgi:WS/DGAT/MGAT family acyltransferase
MSQRLDIDRPLWELWLVEGLPDDRWAIITKTHHAMIDGLAGNELMEIVLDRDPHAVERTPTRWTPESAPSQLRLAASGLAGLAQLPLEFTRSAISNARALSSPSDAVRAALVRAFGLATVGPSMAKPASVLNGPLGPHRRWDWARASLDDVKQAKNVFGVTVNDIVLAAVSGGLRTYLQHLGENVDETTVRSLVPVSIRTDDHKGRLGNQVTALFADLPVDCADPVERVATVARQMNALKQSGQAVGVDAMLSAADFVPPTLMTLGARVYVRTGQRVVNTVTTNIPGPQYPLFLLGRRMLEMFPYIPVAQGVRISIGIVSYDGHLSIGATGDYDAVPDLHVLCSAIEESLGEIVALSQEG